MTIICTDNQWRLDFFINIVAHGKLKENAIRAAKYAGILPRDYDEYVIIKIDGYRNIVKITGKLDYPNAELPQLNNTAYPFDEERIYPMQKIKQEIRYTIN